MQKKVLFLCLLVLILRPAVVFAAVDPQEELREMTGSAALEAGLNDTQRELMGDVSVESSPGFFQSVQNLFSRAFLYGGGYLQEAEKTAAMVLVVCVICGIVGSSGVPSRIVIIAGTLGIGAAAFTGMQSLLALCAETIQELSTFSQLLLPALSTAMIASGAVASGPVIYSLTVLFADLLLGCITKILIPLLYVYLAMALADAAVGNQTLRRFRELSAWIIKTGLKTLLYGFTAFLAITQVISGATDAMTAKAAKLTLSSVVPVVGSIISDASDTILASASVLKNGIGIFGMIAVLSIAILPFLRIGISFLTMKLTAALAGTIAPPQLVSMIDAVSEALGLMLAMTGACALLLLVSSACSLKAVGI